MSTDCAPDHLQKIRQSFAHRVTSLARIPPGSELEAAFATIPREQFVGPPPWKFFTATGSIETVTDDPAVLYQDVVVSLGTASPLNNGQPTLHAHCIHALGIRKGDHILHIGAGSGYYTTILARLVGETGFVDAYEIEPGLAERSSRNLAEFPNVQVHARSGTIGPLPGCDAIYVNAGATEPMAIWLDALKPGGRLLFPLISSAGNGAMLLVTKPEKSDAQCEVYPARFLMQVAFVPCIGARVESTAGRLAKAFQNRNWDKVRTLRRNNSPGETCWCAGNNWWLSNE